jgi:hypothetical protein
MRAALLADFLEEGWPSMEGGADIGKSWAAVEFSLMAPDDLIVAKQYHSVILRVWVDVRSILGKLGFHLFTMVSVTSGFWAKLRRAPSPL